LLSSVARADEAGVCTDPETCGEDSKTKGAPPKKKRKQKVKTILERLGIDEEDMIPKRSTQKTKQKSPPKKKKKKQSQPSEDEDFMRFLENDVQVVPRSELFKDLTEYQVYPTGTGACMTVKELWLELLDATYHSEANKWSPLEKQARHRPGSCSLQENS